MDSLESIVLWDQTMYEVIKSGYEFIVNMNQVLMNERTDALIRKLNGPELKPVYQRIKQQRALKPTRSTNCEKVFKCAWAQQ